MTTAAHKTKFPEACHRINTLSTSWKTRLFLHSGTAHRRDPMVKMKMDLRRRQLCGMTKMAIMHHTWTERPPTASTGERVRVGEEEVYYEKDKGTYVAECVYVDDKRQTRVKKTHALFIPQAFDHRSADDNVTRIYARAARGYPGARALTKKKIQKSGQSAEITTAGKHTTNHRSAFLDTRLTLATPRQT